MAKRSGQQMEQEAGCLDCQPQSKHHDQQQTLQLFLSTFRRQQLYSTAKTTSEMHFMHFSALCSLTQPRLTAYCI